MDRIELDRMIEIAEWLEQQEDKIPNSDRLIHKLRHEQQSGHLVNAEFVKKIFENGIYSITDVENSTDTYDVDIELDKIINIQTWHGQSIAGHIMEAQFNTRGRERNKKLGNVSNLGGVKTDWDKDCETMKKKLSQLPDDKLGIVLLLDRFIGVTILPPWWEEIHDNKCLIKLDFTSYDVGFKNVYGEAVAYHSEKFQHMNEIKKFINSIGFNLKAENMP